MPGRLACGPIRWLGASLPLRTRRKGSAVSPADHSLLTGGVTAIVFTPASGTPPQALLLLLGSITASLPIISFAFVGVITCWLGAVRS